MGKKIALNVFYNLGIILSIFGMIWGYNNKTYIAIILFVVTAAFFLYLKLQLVKEMRNSLKNRK
ncbi:DUF6358 family protein [Pedobacter nyackensis]|uniref:Uncharacterized protein n=1 Tax=Pedobacter nyackensis TaxID=475255 RepID=A0A1W2BKM1_9SPHI|nr:DUF6358 family protein [Pedobacter nyackensis]SMC73330.1 hypothetical protein SAMN04488101_102560 [Pedobacter nyackensis]